MRPGLPPNWHGLADGIRAKTGRQVTLKAAEATFSLGPERIEVRLDHELLGQFSFWWDDEEPDEALADLREALSVYLDEEFRTEDW